MKIEERLNDAMHEYADTIEPDPDSWSRISARFDDGPAPRRSVPGRLVFAGVAITLVIVLITVLAIRDEGPTTKVATDPSGITAPMPERILAILRSGQPVVLDSTNGKQLAAYEATVVDASRIAMSPDGKDAYVVTGDPGGVGCSEQTLLRLPVGVGARGGDQIATAATDPAVSPDGKYLAYLHCVPGPNVSRGSDIVLRDLVTGQERSTAAPGRSSFVGSLGFAADSRHVVVSVDEGNGVTTVHALDLVGSEAAPGPQIPMSPAVFVFGYLGTTGDLLGADARANPTRAIAVASDSGVTRRTLFTTNQPPVLESDRSGRHVLAAFGGAIYRWSEGEDGLTKVGDDLLGAAWIPDVVEAPPAQPASAPSTLLPPGVLTVTTDDWIVSMGSEDGEVHESLVIMPNLLAADPIPPQSSSAIYETMGKGGACTEPPSEIGRVDLATGAKTRIVSGAVSPTVSPDGRFVAYGVVCDGVTLGFTDLRDGTNYRIDPGADAPAALQWVEPLAWAPDSERVLYRAVFRGSEDPSYWIGRVWPPRADAGSLELADSSHVSAAAFVDDQHVALAEPTGRNTAVRVVRIYTRSAGARSSFEVPGRITQLTVDRSGRHFLAVTDDHVLYRWSRGDPGPPTKLADDALSAAWIPWT